MPNLSQFIAENYNLSHCTPLIFYKFLWRDIDECGLVIIPPDIQVLEL